MATISVSLPADGETIDAADYNTPINTIVNEINGNLDNSNIDASAAIAGSKLASGSVDTLQLTDSAVTPAKWTNPYCFRAYASVGTTLTDGSPVKIALATEEYDYNNNFATSTYTAPVAGVYHFDGGVTHASVSSAPVQAYTMIYKNGTEVVRSAAYPGSASVQLTWSVSGDVLLAANDTVNLYHTQDSGGNELSLTGSAFTHFSGHLVHAT